MEPSQSRCRLMASRPWPGHHIVQRDSRQAAAPVRRITLCCTSRRRGWQRSSSSHWQTNSPAAAATARLRSEEHTSELQSLMRISYAVFCLKKKKNIKQDTKHTVTTEFTQE